MTDNTGQPYIEPIAAWKVTLSGKDLTDTIAPRLISLSLKEDEGEKADELFLVLDDGDGKLELPPEGAVITVAMGWKQGTGVPVGLVDKGKFVVDAVDWDGAPDRIRISARSANMRKTYRTRKTRSWHGKTLGAIVAQVSSDHGLTARCHPDLAGTVVASAEQSNQSDMEFMRDLGRRYDAIASPKAGCMVFAPKDATTTATGAKIPELTVTRANCSKPAYHRASRDNAQDGAEAQYHDQGSGKRVTVSTGGSNRRRLKRIYASEADAHAAARSTANRLRRAAGEFRMTMTYGDARAGPGAHAKATGFKTEINAKAWRVKCATHDMDKNGGFSTGLEMEVR
ncbi:contractile injection system protein, VgrG/Pvc8 family [Novosphingobium rosa]|uniref:contractile injection system protein, VgrG/Pvc8 family n=1 Tax=Novosphingobium rosa TaxID=76978 RepID=UPI0008342AE7|nr:contractile injection system protein, VgrG/Pvc8 family [Novosphingobium rosa]